MTNSEIFSRVADHQLTPSEGAALMLQQDREDLARLRPSWIPTWVWDACVYLVVGPQA